MERLQRLWSSPLFRQGVLSIALAVGVAATTVLAVRVFGLQSWARRMAAGVPGIEVRTKPPTHDLSGDQRLVAVTPEPDSREPPKTPSSSTPAPPRLSASELFALAEAARARGDLTEAVRVSKVLLEVFPNSEQGTRTHLTLGVIYMEQKRPELALPELALFRAVGAPELRGEALWTQSLALRQLGRVQDERTVIGELLRTFPRSAFVSAARARLTELDTAADAGSN